MRLADRECDILEILLNPENKTLEEEYSVKLNIFKRHTTFYAKFKHKVQYLYGNLTEQLF